MKCSLKRPNPSEMLEEMLEEMPIDPETRPGKLDGSHNDAIMEKVNGDGKH